MKRVAAGVATLFVYDEAGQLLGQYDSLGQPLQQYLRMDSLPVGVVAGGQLLHVQSDHLGTPRAVIDPTRNVPVWTWPIIGEAFGATVPNEDPDLDGTGFVFDLRFPGQRFDPASGLSQNYFRDYESLIGRYKTPDPIGMRGGMSFYGYAFSRPTSLLDPYGLRVEWTGTIKGVAAIEGVGAGFFLFDMTSNCVAGKIVKARVFAPSVAAGLGARFTGSGSGIKMHDWSDIPDPTTFNGVFVMVSAAIVVGGGGGCSKFTLGSVYSDGICGGPIYGVDVSAGVFGGSSVVISSETIQCENTCAKE